MTPTMAKKESQIIAMPTPERFRHAGDDWTEGNSRDRRDRVVTFLNPFDRAAERKVFTERQWRAGDKFRLCWERGDLERALASVDWGRSPSDVFGRTLLSHTEFQAHHRHQYAIAEKLLGIPTSALLRWVICDGMPFEEAGRRLGWRHRTQGVAAVVERMRDALDRLQDLWGI